MMKIILCILLLSLQGMFCVNCPYGWFKFGGLCLKYVGIHSYRDGVEACKHHGGRMLEPRSEALSDALQYYYSDRWIGVVNGSYESNGEPILYSKPTYTGGYAYVTYNKWYSATCPNARKRVLCELPSVNTECYFPATVFIEDFFESTSFGECQEACASTTGCRFWIFENNRCSLRFYEAGDVWHTGRPDVISGYPTSSLPGYGKQLVGRLEQEVYTASECQKLCYTDPKCITFTWINKDNLNGGLNDNTCIFNYGKPKKVLKLQPDRQSFDIISGSETCRIKSACDGFGSCQLEGNSYEVVVQLLTSPTSTMVTTLSPMTMSGIMSTTTTTTTTEITSTTTTIFTTTSTTDSDSTPLDYTTNFIQAFL